jgi:imidazolonepropionase-like amidohydrolase
MIYSFFWRIADTVLRAKLTNSFHNRAKLLERNAHSRFIIVLPVFVLFFISLTATALATPSDKNQEDRQASVIVLQNMHVLSMQDDQIRANQTIVIRDNKIEWVGNADEAEIPEGARIVTGDFYVMPGLAEMHAHVPVSVNDPTPMYDVLAMYVSQGITTIRGMLGHPLHLELRNQSASGEILAPRIFTSGPSFSGNTARDTTIARQMVRHQAREGYDLLKLHPGLSLEVFEAIVDEANKVGIDFSGHVSYDVGLRRALSAGYGSIEHLDRYMEFLAGDPSDREDPPIIYFGYDLADAADQKRIPNVAQMTLEAGVWNVPTNTLLQNIFDPTLTIEDMQNWPGMEYMLEGTVDNWSGFVERMRNSDTYSEPKAIRFLETRLMLTKSLHDVGAGLLLGADAPQIFNPPGFSIHRELELLVRAGLSPFEALRTGTSNVATYFGESNSAGYIAPGYRADLIVLSVNPIESIPFGDYIEAVIVSGRFHSREALDERLAEIR